MNVLKDRLVPVARFTFGDARLANVPRQDRSIEGPMTADHVDFDTFAGLEPTIQGGICRSPGPKAKMQEKHWAKF